MPNLNKVMLMGNLTRDPELRYLPSGAAVANFGMAVNRKWKNQQGEQQDEVTFIDLEAYGKIAEIISQHLAKGRPVFIEGRLKLDQWQDKEGNSRSKLKVVADGVQFLADGQGKAPSQPQAQDEPQTPPQGTRGPLPGFAKGAGKSAAATGNVHQPVNEDDIPF